MYQTTMKIDGMMCGMCEAHMNDAIRKAVPGASKVKSSHTKGESTFLSETAPDEAALRKAIEETGYVPVSVTTAEYKKKFLGLF
ncbi:MAG: heavy-metal-associated domain-containing protein [Lachnospiraceae bacterium]|nr:heavy-metal-associated domain-containing protein [Lachnospiraceae bacterium]